MEQDLSVPVNSPVKLVIRLHSFIETDFVAHDKTWLGSSSYDQVAKVAVVGFDVALAGTQEQTLISRVSSNPANRNDDDLPFRTTCRRRSRFDPWQTGNLAHLGPGEKSAC